MIWSSLPEEIRGLIRPVAAEDYWKSSWLRRYVAERVFFAIFVSRDSCTEEQRQLQIQRILEGMGREYCRSKVACITCAVLGPTWNLFRSTWRTSIEYYPRASICPCRWSAG